MSEAAFLVYADTESHADLGRVTNALQAAGEYEQAGEEYVVIFDGAATKWVPELEDEDRRIHPLYAAVTDEAEACSY